MTDINQFQPKSSHEIHTLRKLIVWRGGKQHQILEKIIYRPLPFINPRQIKFFSILLTHFIEKSLPSPHSPKLTRY